MAHIPRSSMAASIAGWTIWEAPSPFLSCPTVKRVTYGRLITSPTVKRVVGRRAGVCASWSTFSHTQGGTMRLMVNTLIPRVGSTRLVVNLSYPGWVVRASLPVFHIPKGG